MRVLHHGHVKRTSEELAYQGTTRELLNNCWPIADFGYLPISEGGAVQVQRYSERPRRFKNGHAASGPTTSISVSLREFYF